MFKDFKYGRILELNDLKQEVGKKINFPVNIDKNKRVITLFTGYDNVLFNYQNRSSCLFPKNLIYQYKTNDEELVSEFYDLIKDNNVRVILIDHHKEDTFGFIGEVNIYIRDFPTKVSNKIYLEFYIKDEYASVKNTLNTILYNKINKYTYNETNTIEENFIQNIILDIMDKYVVLTTGIEEEKRNFYFKNYIRKILYYSQCNETTSYRITKEILSLNLGFDADYNTYRFEYVVDAYNKFIEDIRDIDLGLGIGVNKSYIILTFLYTYFYTYKKLESSYKNFLKGKYDEENFSVFIKKLKSYISDFEDLDIKQEGDFHSYDLEYELLERLYPIYRISLISSILEKRNLEPSEYLIKDMICILKIRDVDYSIYLINRYFIDEDRFNKLACVKEAILYNELIIFIVELVINLLIKGGYEIDYDNNFYSTSFNYNFDMNIDNELNKIIFDNRESIEIKRSKCENKEENKTELHTRLFYSERFEYDYILDKIHTCIYGDVFRI